MMKQSVQKKRKRKKCKIKLKTEIPSGRLITATRSEDRSHVFLACEQAKLRVNGSESCKNLTRKCLSRSRVTSHDILQRKS